MRHAVLIAAFSLSLSACAYPGLDRSTYLDYNRSGFRSTYQSTTRYRVPYHGPESYEKHCDQSGWQCFDTPAGGNSWEVTHCHRSRIETPHFYYGSSDGCKHYQE